jgi:flagellar biosynthesis protein FlhF
MNYFSIEVEDISELKPKLYNEIKKRNISADRVVILTKKPIKKGGFLGIGAKTVYQVWFQILDSQDNQNNRIQHQEKSVVSQPADSSVTKESEIASSLYKEIDAIKKMLQDVMMDNKKVREIAYSYIKNKEANFEKVKEKMLEKDFPIGFITKILDRIDNEFSEDEKQNFFLIYSKVRDVIAEGIKVASTDIVLNKKPKIVILVGPTGVGKTTTLVKLAFQWGALKKNKFVFFSLDKYRAGASHQLKSFAEIFKVPMIIIKDKESLANALQDFGRDSDIVFIDTAGTSPKNTITINDLSDHLKVLRKYDLFVSLVMSAVTKYKDMLDIINRYSVLNYSNVILTKIDETTTFGSSVAALYDSGIPLSFVTNGQRVEKDIMAIKPVDLLQMALDDIV